MRVQDIPFGVNDSVFFVQDLDPAVDVCKSGDVCVFVIRCDERFCVKNTGEIQIITAEEEQGAYIADQRKEEQDDNEKRKIFFNDITA